MSVKRFGRVQRATSVVPLALLSAALTASLVGVGATSTAIVSADAPPAAPPASLPDGASVPDEAIEAPASVSGSTKTGKQSPAEAQQIVSSSSANGIPSVALAAYQRAESVINAADKTCNITWQLVAAIGRVESNHGRFGGSALNDDGLARPGIFGVPLNGQGVATIRDTDAGQFDNDTTFDRAVGPMQFIPSTWSVVGVDADNDGQRNPQDVDDAALGAAVYLCSGNDDLSTVGGQRSAIFRYNRSNSYVDLVLSIANNYLQGDFSTVPNGTTAAGMLTPSAPATQPGGSAGGNQGSGDNNADQGGTKLEPSEPAPTEEPGDGGETPQQPGNGGNNNGGGNNNNSGPKLPLPPVKVPNLPDTGIDPVDDLLTRAEAIVQCTLDGLVNNPLNPQALAKFNQCVENYMTKGKN